MPNQHSELKVGVGGYVSLALAILFFSGLLYGLPAAYRWAGAFDFVTLIGKFGTIAGSKSTFVGSGGTSARGGFIFVLSLFPSVMLALGAMELFTHYGALKAAQKLLTPLTTFLMRVPGGTTLALVTDLQSTDGGAALTRGFYDSGMIDKKQLVTICAWQYSGAGCINNYYSIVSPLFVYFTKPVWIPVVIFLAMKFVAGNLALLCLNTIYRKDFE